MMKIGFISQWFSPEPVGVPVWIANELRRRGNLIRVLTGIPNYPDGKVQTGYKAWEARQEIVDGIEVVRAPLYPSHDGRAFRRFLNYVSWAFFAGIVAPKALRGTDVNLVYGSPLTAVWPAIVGRLIHRTPFVIMVQDLWPDSVFSSGFLPRGALIRFAKGVLQDLCDKAYRGANGVVVIAPGMIDELVRRGVAHERIHLVFNWADEAVYRPTQGCAKFRTLLGIPQEDRILMYAGNHGVAQNLDLIIKALKSLDIKRHRLHLVFVGEGVEKANLVNLAAGHPRIHFHSGVRQSRMAELMWAADVQLVSLRKDPLFAMTIPSKVQATLACGRPFIIIGEGDAVSIADSSGAGWKCNPDDLEQLADVLDEVSNTDPHELLRRGRQGLAWYLRCMSSSVGAKRLEEALASTVQR